MGAPHKLVLFTLEFPFGNGEAFLESEINYLSLRFDEIFILPSYITKDQVRRLPSNVQVIRILADNQEEYRPIKLKKYFFEFVEAYFYSLLFSKRRYNYLRYVKSMMHYFHRDISKLNLLINLIDSKDLTNAIFYDYWLLNSSISLIQLKKIKKIDFIACRAHRFDLYDDQHIEGVVPFKEYKIKNVDRIITISEQGEQYLKTQTRKAFIDKISTHYLGVNRPNKIPKKASGILIVSCSNIIPLKQVDKIAKAIAGLTLEIKWVHFGDGPDRSKVESLIQSFPSNISVELKGSVPNSEIHSFYEANFVDVFISLSASEGLPVSMMEAISYGIPVIAPPVGGVSEIVNNNTGILLEDKYSIQDATNALHSIIVGKILKDRNAIIEFFNYHFWAERNYNGFIDDIIEASNLGK